MTKNDFTKTKKTSKTIALLALVTALTKVFGFAREILFGKWYGVSDVAEAFKIAQTIPMLLLLVVGTGISTGFIPLYSQLEKKHGTQEADRFMSNLINLLMIVGLLFSVIVTAFPEIFVKLFASGFTGEKLKMTIQFTQIGIWAVVFNMATYVMQPYLQIKDDYMTPALMVIPGNMVFILMFYLAMKSSILLLPLSIIAAICVQFLWLLPKVYKNGYGHKRILKVSDPSIRKFLILATPIIFSVAINQVNIMVDKNIASHLMDGAVAMLDYANKMTTFVQAILIYPVAAVFFPNITRYLLDEDHGKVMKSTSNAMILLAIFVVPSSVGLLVLSEPVIKLLFSGEAFPPQALNITAQAMLFYAAGLFFWAWRDLLVRLFYALGNTKTPTINAAIGVGCNIILNLMLSKFMGIPGLALATSISSLIILILMIISLKKYPFIQFDWKLLLNRVLKITLASVVMGVVTKLTFNQLSVRISSTKSLLLSIVIAVVAYFACLLLVRIPEFDSIKNHALEKIKNKRRSK